MLQVLGECLLEVLLNALGLPALTSNCSGSYHSSLVAVIAAEPTVPTLCCPSRDIGPRGGAFCAAGAGWLGWATEGADMRWSWRRRDDGWQRGRHPLLKGDATCGVSGRTVDDASEQLGLR